MTMQFPSIAQTLAEEIGTLRKWLDEDALPLWWEAGSARPDGGFYERLGQDAKPVFSDDRRARVQPRQAYCFAAAGQHGWQGPWKDALLHGLSWFEKVYRLENGLYGNLADQTGRLIDPSFDLYNQAFALFAAAQAAASLPELRDEMRGRALDILAILERDYRHPVAGFEEANPPRTPLCSNPHMHLFEAMLAWEVQDPDGPWSALADEIADLALNRFIDGGNGGLREFFAHDWTPYEGEKGRIMEPGHQFEWFSLVMGEPALFAGSALEAALRRAFAFAQRHGVAAGTLGVGAALAADGTLQDATQRIWAQTEFGRALAVEGSARSLDTLALWTERFRSRFLHDGGWHEVLGPGGEVLRADMPSTTPYHLLGAYQALQALVGRV